jgi:tetratricopeptide (TPR) repeat protein
MLGFYLTVPLHESDCQENSLQESETAHESGLNIRDAIALYQRGVHDEALTKFETALGEHADHAFGQLHYAVALSEVGRHEEALDRIEKALALNGDMPAFRLFAGRVYFDAGRYEDACAQFDKALELNPENVLAAGFRTISKWAAGDADAVRELSPKTLPESSVFLARLLWLIERDLKGRHIDYEDLSTPVPFLDHIRANFTMWRARKLAKAGHHEAAIEMSDPLLEITPGHAATIRFQKECRDAAIQNGARMVEESPDDVELRMGLVGLLVQVNDFETADSHIREIERLCEEKGDSDTPGYPAYLRLRAMVAYGAGRIEEALELTHKGTEPGFSMLETNFYLGLCNMESVRNKSFAAFRAFVDQLCWIVALRLREYLAWLDDPACLARPTSSET